MSMQMPTNTAPRSGHRQSHTEEHVDEVANTEATSWDPGKCTGGLSLPIRWGESESLLCPAVFCLSDILLLASLMALAVCFFHHCYLCRMGWKRRTGTRGS